MSDRKRQATVGSQYQNYRVPTDGEIPVVHYDGSELAPAAFYDNYIRPRCPVKFTGHHPPLQPPKNVVSASAAGAIDLASFMPDVLEDTLRYDGVLQVEKKHQHGFGSGQERLRMTVGELMTKFRRGGGDYYLTTQYEEDEAEDDDDDDGDDGDDDDDDEALELALQNETNDDFNDHPGGSDDTSKNALQNDDDSDDDSIDLTNLTNLHDDFEDVEKDFEDDNSDNEDDGESAARLRGLLQPPLTNLIHHPNKLPLIPSIFSTLIPQQINLWMGQSGAVRPEVRLDAADPTCGLGKYIPGASGSSSGLHHDHADNLYVPICGKKRFTLFSPADASRLHTVGDIYKVYNSGIIDYEVNDKAHAWRHIRDDGAIVEEVIRWQLESSESSDAPDAKRRQQLLQELEHEHQRSRQRAPPAQKLDPPNFSTIPPGLLHIDEFPDAADRAQLEAFAREHFPGFLDLNRFTVWLEPGDMLYLPAGWFHEVSSFGEDHHHNVHVALNYWFVPPNADSAHEPYDDDYWAQDWDKTQQCIDHVLGKASQQGQAV